MVHLDVIEGNLTLLIRLPTLKAIQSSLNFEFENLGAKINGSYHRLRLEGDFNHLYLPFGNSTQQKQYGRRSTYTRGSIPSQQLYISSTPKTSAYRPEQNILTPSILDYTPRSNKTISKTSKTFRAEHLKRLYLALRHGSKSAMAIWIRASSLWNDKLDKTWMSY